MKLQEVFTRYGPVIFSVLLVAGQTAQAALPVVSNVRASQRAGTGFVDIYYDVADADGDLLKVSVAVSLDGGASYASPARSFSGDGYGPGVAPGADRHIQWDAGTDLNPRLFSRVKVRVVAEEPSLILIPAGSFEMGDPFGERVQEEQPVHTVYVSAFYLERYEVTKDLWDLVKAWSDENGYDYEHPGLGKGPDHPVHTANWYDVVKWCNARSEKDGYTPVYYTDAALTQVYRTGRRQATESWPYANWEADGYRLATEAEWEKAARGGVAGTRYPWGNTISHTWANYDSVHGEGGYHPAYNDGTKPYTSPVGSFPVNGYGLHDMIGNLSEWCWDWNEEQWYRQYPEESTEDDTRGPSWSTGYRTWRGGSWAHEAFATRCSWRYGYNPVSAATFDLGFRCARKFQPAPGLR